MCFDFVVCVDWPVKRKLDGGTHTGEVYLTEPLEWQGAGSGCWLGRKKVELEATIRVGLGLEGPLIWADELLVPQKA